MILAFICMMLFFITPRPYYTKYKKLSLILLVIAFVVAILGMNFILKPHQLGRITTWLNPLLDEKPLPTHSSRTSGLPSSSREAGLQPPWSFSALT